jgi:hypothetical protein
MLYKEKDGSSWYTDTSCLPPPLVFALSVIIKTNVEPIRGKVIDLGKETDETMLDGSCETLPSPLL